MNLLNVFHFVNWITEINELLNNILIYSELMYGKKLNNMETKSFITKTWQP